MANKRLLIFVPEINDRTFVLFFYRGMSGRSYSVRDYTRNPLAITRQHDYPYTAEEIVAFAERKGRHCFEAPAVSTDETGFWLECIQELNEQYLDVKATPGAAPSTRTRSDEGAPRVIRPTTPFGNRLALEDLLSSAIGTVRWYERHMPHKVLNELYRHLKFASVPEIRLLSGRQGLDMDTRERFDEFSAEIRERHATQAEWRILSNTEASRHHDRVFISDSGAFNVPPINSWLKDQTSEISPSGLGPTDFDSWWDHGTTLGVEPAGNASPPISQSGTD